MSDETLEATSFRLPAAILAAVRKRASANRRSLNSEMIVILEKAVPENEKADAEPASA